MRDLQPLPNSGITPSEILDSNPLDVYFCNFWDYGFKTVTFYFLALAAIHQHRSRVMSLSRDPFRYAPQLWHNIYTV